MIKSWLSALQGPSPSPSPLSAGDVFKCPLNYMSPICVPSSLKSPKVRAGFGSVSAFGWEPGTWEVLRELDRLCTQRSDTTRLFSSASPDYSLPAVLGPALVVCLGVFLPLLKTCFEPTSAGPDSPAKVCSSEWRTSPCSRLEGVALLP